MRDNSEEAPDEAPAGGGDKVRILTIHAAKGLEAPVVFLADAAQSGSADKAYRAFVQWPTEAPRPSHFLLLGRQEQQPALFRQLLEEESREQAREAANLLYVALTRARQLLYISGVQPGRGDDSGWYGALRQALDPQGTVAAAQSCRLESGTPPATGRPAAPEPALPPEPDPRLARPLTLSAEPLELAPSYRAAAEQSALSPGDEDGRLRGLVIHRLLQLMSEQAPAQWPAIRQGVAAEFSLEEDSLEYRQWYEECRDLLECPSLAALFRPAAGVESLNEVPIIYPLQQRTVYGIIDRLLLLPDEIWVIDYKSHRHAGADTCRALADGYRMQLGYYAAGVQRLWPQRRVRSFLLFTAPRLLHELETEEPPAASPAAE
jgi:ATP-dependent helicase/nuclease subunit A